MINDKKMQIANKVINSFINCTISDIDVFCKKTKIPTSTFYSYLNLVKENNHILYNKYIYKCSITKQRSFIYMLSTTKTLIFYLKNGIQENNNVREFNLLDYYLLTKIDQNTILDFLNKYDKDNVYLFNEFREKYKDIKLLSSKDIKNILSNKDYIENYFDNIIPNIYHEISKKNKEIVLNYLKERGIPLYDILYTIALKKYLNERLLSNNNEIFKKSI